MNVPPATRRGHRERQQAVAYSSQLVSHSSQFRSNRGFSGERGRRHEHLSTSGIPFERERERKRESGGLMTPHHWPISRDTECLMARRRPPSSSFALSRGLAPVSTHYTLHKWLVDGRLDGWMVVKFLPLDPSANKATPSSAPPMIISMVWQFGPPPPPQTH